MNSQQEMALLEDIATTFSSREGFNYKMSEFASRAIFNAIEAINKHWEYRGLSCLEVGCSDGALTYILVDAFKKVVALDGSAKQIERLEAYITNPKDKAKLTTVVSLIEDYNCQEKFDVIILSYVLEHVVNPIEVLAKCKSLLTPKGQIIIVVPNGESLHRRVGQSMGLICNLTDLSSADHRDGHRRTYTLESLKKDINAAGLSVCYTSGILLKPYPESTMATIDFLTLETLYKTGIELDPTLCSSLLTVAI